MFKKYLENVLGSSPGTIVFHRGAENVLVLASGRKLGLPDSGKIGLSVGGARRLSGKVRFAVARAGSPGAG